MNYSLSIDLLTEAYPDWARSFYADITDEHILDLSMDAKTVSGDNFLKLKGRKAKITLAWNGTVKGIIESIPLHSGFKNTYLACLISVFDEDRLDFVFTGSVRNDTISIDENELTISFYISDPLDTLIEIAREKGISLQGYNNRVSIMGDPHYPFTSLIRECLKPFSATFGATVVQPGLDAPDVYANDIFFNSPMAGFTIDGWIQEVTAAREQDKPSFFECVHIWNLITNNVSAFVIAWFYGYARAETNVYVRGLRLSVPHDNPFTMGAGYLFEYDNLSSFSQVAVVLQSNYIMPTGSVSGWVNVLEVVSPDGLKTLKYVGQASGTFGAGFTMTAPLNFATVPLKDGTHRIADIIRASAMSNRLSLDSRILGNHIGSIHINRALLPEQSDSGDLTNAIVLTDDEIFDFVKEGNLAQTSSDTFSPMDISDAVINLLNEYYRRVAGAYCYRIKFDTNTPLELLDKIAVDSKAYFVISISDKDDYGYQKVIAVGGA